MRNHDFYYTFSFLQVFFIILFFFSSSFFTISANTTLSSTETLTIHRTIVSPNGVFELGFFEFDSNSRWYLGIWYKNELEKIYVWVANRDHPLTSSMGVLRISNSTLELFLGDQSNTPVWSANPTRDPRSSSSVLVGELRNDGNFVLRESDNNKNEDEFLWQSFDFPTDTLLPGMKLGLDRTRGLNKMLTNWKNMTDPSSGYHTFQLESIGLPEFWLTGRGPFLDTRSRSGAWDGTRFPGPLGQQLYYLDYNFTDNREEMAYSFIMINQGIYSRLSLDSSGILRRYTKIPPSELWDEELLPKDICDVFNLCSSSYEYCDMNKYSYCKCLQGFEEGEESPPTKKHCERKIPLSCKEDGFLKLKQKKLPVITNNDTVKRELSTKECESMCFGNCNCMAFANTDHQNGRGSGCIMWMGELRDIRHDPDELRSLHVRVHSSQLDEGEDRNKSTINGSRGKIIGSIVGVVIIIILGVSVSVFYFWKRMEKADREISTPPPPTSEGTLIPSRREEKRVRRDDDDDDDEREQDIEVREMGFQEIEIATDHFSESNKLGQGGFGAVYKGKLANGQEIAVKRLSKMSSQGVTEFNTELNLIKKLQHKNLVRLIGWCDFHEEKLLVYEYLQNLSLDFYLFGKTEEAPKLNWETRFNIINGIARGVLYLHEDSQLNIIHRDLKASNILLDKQMKPKISDFGLAKPFMNDNNILHSRQVVGTFGYMSPEYTSHGIYSTSSDVYSFGVLLLEIITGKRNKGFSNSHNDLNLLAWVWRKWNEGKVLEVVDPFLLHSSSSSETTLKSEQVIRSTHVGLLCVQTDTEIRPPISSVIMMLGSQTAVFPPPQLPGYCIPKRDKFETERVPVHFSNILFLRKNNETR